MQKLSFSRLVSLLILSFVILFAAGYLFAWTGPTATAPAGNISAPVNVGTTDQVKNAGLSVNALTIFGSAYIQNKVGINAASPVVALQVAGTLMVGNGGEVCQAVTEGSQRYNSTTKRMEFCNGTAWGAIGTASPLEVAAYESFSDSTGSVVVGDSYNLTLTTLGYGYYQADFTTAQSDLNYLVFFSPSYDGGAALTMWELGTRTTSNFKFYCTHASSGNRWCGDHASILVLKKAN